jgi:hypothetical protein
VVTQAVYEESRQNALRSAAENVDVLEQAGLM